MSTAVHLSLEEYLNTDYEPDCDYVEGILEERNVGKKTHSKVQMRLSAWLYSRVGEHKQDVLLEQRVQVSRSRVRIPRYLSSRSACNRRNSSTAACPLCRDPFTRRPLDRVQDRLTDLLSFGVPTIWIVNPYTKEAWIATPDAPVAPVTDRKLRCPALNLEVELSEILPESDLLQ
jgi:hypothetical protein